MEDPVLATPINRWTAEHVAAWLKSVKLPAQAVVLRDAGVDGQVLMRLDEPGVYSLVGNNDATLWEKIKRLQQVGWGLRWHIYMYTYIWL